MEQSFQPDGTVVPTLRDDRPNFTGRPSQLYGTTVPTLRDDRPNLTGRLSQPYGTTVPTLRDDRPNLTGRPSQLDGTNEKSPHGAGCDGLIQFLVFLQHIKFLVFFLVVKGHFIIYRALFCLCDLCFSSNHPV